MEIFGNAQALKKAIEIKYSSKIKKIEEEKEKQLEEIGKELKKKLELLRAHMKTDAEAAAKNAYSIILNREKLKAKKDFEETRESIIESVFNKAENRAKSIAHTNEYIGFVKRNIPEKEKLTAIGDSDYYKKHFPGLKIGKNIIGLKFESENLSYDFAISSLISSKKEMLRHDINKILLS